MIVRLESGVFFMNRIFLCLLVFLCANATVRAQNNLEVKVTNIRSAKGKIMLALYRQPNGFPDSPEKAFLLRTLPAQKGALQVALPNVPPGTYALAIFHDANDDGKLNTNLLGIPKEDYGFSNQARPGFRAPTFSEASIKISGNSAHEVEIK